eukprot:148289_1
MEVTNSFCSYALNVSEQCAVKASLTEIKLNENFESTRFWGKLFGIECDYLVIQATTITHAIQHKYFFSIDGGLRFAQLPIVEPWMESKCMEIASLFTGITSFVYEKQKKESENEDQEEDKEENDDEAENINEDEPPNTEYKLTELDRVAWTISKINDECCIVPQNSVLLTSSKIIEKNNHFKALSRADANSLDSYLHFRTPRDPYAVSKYRKATAMNDTGFLDPITNDLPRGCWRLQSKKGGLEVSIKNLLWNGFQFKYNVGETQFIQAYFGNGIRRNDLVFMI